jgi:hypothetical protein
MAHPIPLSDLHLRLIANRAKASPPLRLLERVLDELIEIEIVTTEQVHHAVGRAMRAAA